MPRVKPIEVRDANTYEFNLGDAGREDTIRIGGDDPNVFEPKVKMGRFSQARVPTELEFELLDPPSGTNHRQVGERIELEDADKRYQVYGLEAENIDGMEDGDEGGVELELVLKRPLPTNVFRWRVRGDEHLRWVYQPPLTLDSDTTGMVNVTETHAESVDGSEVLSRPETVAGSYAVYYQSTAARSDKGQRRIRVGVGGGKAFHVYRPKIVDNAGRETWGTLNYDESNGVLRVTIAQSWLDAATYPVSIDPTIGQTTIGGTLYAASTSQTSGYIIVTQFQTGAVNGTYVTTSAYGRRGQGRGVIYNGSTDIPSTLRTYSNTVARGGSNTWKDYDITDSEVPGSATNWIGVFVGNYTGNVEHYYDSDANADESMRGNWLDVDSAPYNNWSSWTTQTDHDRIYSLYATYDEAASTPVAAFLKKSKYPL